MPKTAADGKEQKQAKTIWVHNRDSFTNIRPNGFPPDLVFSPLVFPQAQDGDIFEITTTTTDADQKSLCFVVSGNKCEEKDRPRLQLSILEPIAKLFAIANRSSVHCRVLGHNSIPDTAELEFVELTFKVWCALQLLSIATSRSSVVLCGRGSRHRFLGLLFESLRHVEVSTKFAKSGGVQPSSL